LRLIGIFSGRKEKSTPSKSRRSAGDPPMRKASRWTDRRIGMAGPERGAARTSSCRFKLPPGVEQKSRHDPFRRVPGESFAPATFRAGTANVDYDAPHDTTGTTSATFDNDATTTHCDSWRSHCRSGPTTPRIARPSSAVSIHLRRAISERRLAAGLAASRRLPRRHHLHDDAMLHVLELLDRPWRTDKMNLPS